MSIIAYMATTRGDQMAKAKHHYTISTRLLKECGLFLVYRDSENIACATTETEAKQLIRYFQDDDK